MDSSMSPADVVALTNGENGGMNAWWMIILFALIWGGNGLGFGGNGFANAIGYDNLATSNEVQRGFADQNSLANEREILGAVNAGTAQLVQTDTQNMQYLSGQLNDKYGELQRDIAGLAVGQANLLANQNACCSSVSAGIAQNRYEAAMNTSSIIQAVQQEGAATRSMMQENKIEALQQKLNGMEQALNTQMLQSSIQQATAGVVRYPDSWTYNAGSSPFCGCNNGCYSI